MIGSNRDALMLSAVTLRAAPLALQRRAVRKAIGFVRGELTNIGYGIVESILAAVNGSPATEITLPVTNGARPQTHLRVSEDAVRIWSEAPTIISAAWQVTLDVPGEIDMPFGDMCVSADVIPVHLALEDSAEGAASTESSATTCWFRSGDLADVLTIRSWRPGDRIQLRGLSGTKKLQDLYTDCKVPRSDRDYLPVVECNREGDAIVAVLGLRGSILSLNGRQLRDLAACNPDEPITVLRLLRAI